MKKLKKMRLINWHRFVDETIDFGSSVLLSGENGAGKSTLLDAIQFVITCSKNNFNKAAHDKGKRTLNTYIRCKTGREDRPFERTGEITSHIALEFYDEAKKQSFLVGAVMDSASEEKEPNVIYYLADKQALKDELFLRGDHIKSISEFRGGNKSIKCFSTQSEARKMYSARFGRLEEKFFQLIPKALAFRPINDIKDFVYSYVLDKKEVNIDILKENVRAFQNLELLLQSVKQRIGELENIRKKEAEVEAYLRVDRAQEYYLTRASVDIGQEEVRECERRRDAARLRAEECSRQKSTAEERERKLDETITDLKAELRGNEEFIALSNLQKEEQELKMMLKQNAKEVQLLYKNVAIALEEVEKLKNWKEQDECLQRYGELLRDLEKLESFSVLRLTLEEVLKYKKEQMEKLLRELAEQQILQRNKEEALLELRKKIENLEKRKLTYPPEVTALKEGITEAFRKMNRTGEVRVLCELLEITNPAWQNAVEGYLNTQRFYLLVEPEDFDLALSVYDRLRENKKAFGAGLINAGKLSDYDEVPKDSLAELVSSKSIWAKRYINMILGKVHRCNSAQELKLYPVSITRQCMRYQNHVVSAIRPEIFRTPYIGQDAYLRQLEQSQKEEKERSRELEDIRRNVSVLKEFKAPLESDRDQIIKYKIDFLEEKRQKEGRLQECKEAIHRIKKDSTLIDKQIRLEELGKELEGIKQQISAFDQRIGSDQNAVKTEMENILHFEEEIASHREALKLLSERLKEEAEEFEREYEKLIRKRNLREFRQSYEISRKGNWTKKQKTEDEMIQLMRGYKIAHDFGAPDSLVGFPMFEEEYHKLKDSQLLEFEEKVQRARSLAEEEFREQFLARLQENIKQAQGELRELNKGLENIHFSKERYVFRHEPSRKLKKYYNMIMDDMNMLEGTSIFSGVFQQNHREVIEELFEKLANSDESSAAILEEYTDYRSFMDYDIEIRNDDGGIMFYSKVSREKSGGETQTPFYITVAASFMQLYRNSIGGDSIGLVMLDEAFNNMDDERISGVLQFMTGYNLQMVIAAPPDKIQYIAPSVEKVLLVLQDGDMSYVEDFTNHGRAV